MTGGSVSWRAPRRCLSPEKAVVRRSATICNRRGLHARAAARFVELVDRFGAEVTVRRGDVTVSGASIMGLMMLAAGPGSAIEISATGADAEAVVVALCAMIDAGFEEN